MSRSFKKNPGYYDRNPFMKRQANKRIRQIDPTSDTLADGKQYRKYMCSYYICDSKWRFPSSFEEFVRYTQSWSHDFDNQARNMTFRSMPESMKSEMLTSWWQGKSK